MNENMKAIMKLSKINSYLLKKIDVQLSIHGINYSEFMVMYYLYNTSNKTMRRIDLAENIGLSASGVTRLLNPMEKNHLIQKEINPRDARVSLVKISSVGEQLFNEALISFKDSANSLLQSINIKQLTKLLELIEVNI